MLCLLNYAVHHRRGQGPLKQLTIVRHAKSSWKHPGMVDHDRPLNARGERDAPEMGRRLAARGVLPDLVLSSPALRALTTAQVITGVIGYPADYIALDVRVYEAAASDLLDLIRETDDKVGSVMVFGHNPAVTGLVNRLSETSLDNLPTCGVAEFLFDMKTWAKLGKIPASDVRIDYPKKASA